MCWLKSCILLMVSLILASCSSGNFLDYKDVAQQNDLPKFVEQGDYIESDGVVLLSTTDINMELYAHSVGTTEVVHRMKKLFKNIEKYAFVEIPVYQDEKMDKISARTIKADGTVITLKSEDFYKSTGEGEGSTFYSDKSSIKFTFPSIEKNCIIEYEYTKLKFFPFVTDVWYINHDMPTLMNRYTLSMPKVLVLREVDGGFGWNWNYKAYNYELGTPTVQMQSLQNDMGRDKVKYIWTLKNVLPLKEEVSMPPVDDFIGYVKFAPSDWKKWNDISGWYYKKYFEPQLIVSDDIQSLASRLTKDTDSKTDKIRKLYDYVKDIRYVSISLGSGSIMPSKPADILKRQYGDCKDKSILLISLLKAAGIDSKPVLVLTSDEGHLDPNFPNWRFNHMIVKASCNDKDCFWLDPTSKYSPLGKLPYMDENVNVLVLNPDYTSQIERTPGTLSKDNSTDISLTLDLKDGGSADFNVCLKYHGASNSHIRYKLEDKTDKEMKEYCKSLITDEFSNSEITNCEVSDVDSLKSVCCLKFKGTAGKIIQNQSDLVLLSPDPFKFFESTAWLIKDTREFPINFDYPFSINKSITINLPKGYSVRNLPGRLVQVTTDLDYLKDISQKDNSIMVSESFKLLNSQILPSQYTRTKSFFETIKNNYNEKIILSKN